MATESQRSEIMSGAPSSSESASPMPAQPDVSADAALILAALGRMEAVVRDERAAFTRLRVMLGDMAQAITRAKAVADSETAATLLNELEHRVDAMIEIASPGPVAAAAATPAPQPPSSAAPVERDDAPLAHGTSEAPHASAALDAGAAAQAIQHPAEHDQVPTVSDVVSQLGSDDETPPAAATLPPADDTGSSAPTVAMLTAMVEALRDSISAAPEAEAALESPTPQAAAGVAQPLGLAPAPETSSIEIAEVATPAAEIVHAAEAAHLIEAPQAEAPQAVAATHTVEVAEAAAIPPPADAVPDNSAFVAMLRARLDALNAAAAAAALEPEAPVAEVAAQPLDVTPQPETSSIEIAEVATPAAEIVHAAEAAHLIEAPQAEAPQAVAATHTVEVAEAAAIPPPADAVPDNSAFVAMLRARLDALNAAAAAAALEPEAPVAEVAAQPLDVTPQPETSSIEIAEVATPAAEIVHAAEAAHLIEAPQAEAPQAVAATHTDELAEAADIPPPADPTPEQNLFVAMLNARLAELNASAAASVPEPEAPLEAPRPAPQPEGVAQPLDMAPPASEAIHTADVADAAPIPGPAVTDLHESALLASLEQMGARPFPPPDEGTAVIFAPKPELEFLPEFAREPMALSETPEPGHVALSQPATEPAAIEQTVFAQTAAETTMAEIIADLTQAVAPAPAAHVVEVAAADVERAMPIEPTAEPAPALSDMAVPTTTESDFDPADFLFGPEPEPDPAAFLLDPAPTPAPAPKAPVLSQPDFVATPAKQAAENPEALPPVEPDSPAQKGSEPAPRDPLHALKAMSENEKLALFS